jgi:hypothetical protein
MASRAMPVRRSLLFLSLVSTFGLMIGSRANAANLTLAWDAEADAAVAGYLLSYGTQSGTYTAHIDTGNTTVQTLADLADGTTYYFVVQAYDSQGNVSDPSAEISGQTPGGSGSTPPSSPLSIACPTQTANSSDGNPVGVLFSDPTVMGGISPVTTTCAPASGTQFPVGSNVLNCTAVDASQQTASCTSVVVVLSTAPPVVTPPGATPPTITCPSISPVAADATNTAVVTYADPSVSGGAPPVLVKCEPASGSTFNLGISNVVCGALDANQQGASCITVATVEATPSGESTSSVLAAQPTVTTPAVSDPGAPATPTPTYTPAAKHRRKRRG